MVLGPNQSGKPCDSQKGSFRSPTSHAHDDDDDDFYDDHYHDHDHDDDYNYHQYHQARHPKLKSDGEREVFRPKH